MRRFTKSIFVLFVKYMPSVLALTCAIKIWCLTMSEAQKDAWLYAVNYINVFYDLIGLGGIFCCGRFLGFCWKHRSLCRMALFGYLYYIAFLVFGINRSEIRLIALVYMIMVIITTILYARQWRGC